tara:strand:- start:183 stop:458 length:276 start_codon:yes stop_codon:yes gene_type:complete
MANIFWNSKNKASREEAKSSLMRYIAEIWPDTFTVDFWSDDGGHMIRAILEVEDPEEVMTMELRSLFEAKWMGWRMVVLKVPIGHVKVFYS